MSHKATPEQWEDQEIWANQDHYGDSDSSCILELRDTLAALEQRVKALEQNAAMLADIGDAFERAGQRLTAATAPLIVSDEAFDELQTMIKQDQETHAPAPAAEPAASDDAWQEFLQELHSLQERALREGIGPRCDLVMWARLLWNGAPAAEPGPDELPPKVGHIFRLAEIIREVDGNHDKGAAALAEAILSHPRIGEVLPSEAPTPATASAPEALIDPADDIVDAEGKPWNRTMDGALWAKAFCRRFGGDEGLMIAWFCSAIMAGWDHAHWKMEADAQSAPAPRRQLPGPQQIAECGGPCETIGPEACDCGQFPPLPAPAGSLVEVVAALIANGIACDREAERIAADVIAAVAEWLERHHTGRIANGSQFADLLREALEREVGR